MIKLKTLGDIQHCRNQNSVTKKLLDHLEEYFHQLYEALSDGESLEEFSLEQHGYFVILEAGDNLRDLHKVGLNPQDRGLLGAIPEYVEQVSFEDSLDWYKVAVLYDNEYMMFFYLQAELFDNDVKEWLADHAEDEEFSLHPETAATREED